MTGWKNPYLVVREDGIGFLDLSNREIHILKVEEFWLSWCRFHRAPGHTGGW